MPADFKVAPGVTVSKEGLERALDSHKAAGLIRSWRPRPLGQPSNHARYWLWQVITADGHEVYLANVWELHAFTCGLASARQAAARLAGELAARWEREYITDDGWPGICARQLRDQAGKGKAA